MRILHYSLGLAPQRSGGMTRYATDLMREQAQEHSVALLYPSGYKWWSRKIKWRRVALRGQRQMAYFELANSLPVALLYGVRSPEKFTLSRTMSQTRLESLYDAFKPDVLHIHTLMGLPLELLRYFKSRGVKLVFTTHDYYAICPKVNMIDYNGELCEGASPRKCELCNKSSRSTFFLRLRNSALVLNLKNNPLLRSLYERG